MTAIHPPTETLYDLLAGDVFLAARGVGKHVNEVVRHLTKKISSAQVRGQKHTHQTHRLHIVDQYLNNDNGQHWLTVESGSLQRIV